MGLESMFETLSTPVYIIESWAIGMFIISLLLLLTFAVLHIRALWKIQQTQRGILAALEAISNTSDEMVEAIKEIRSIPVTGSSAAEDEDDDDEGETPADFVYCPECSTRVEIDPSIRNINVVCPDCKKPFHIH